MPQSFTPDNYPRFESFANLLRYTNENFQSLKNLLSKTAVETIGATAPSSPYTGQEYIDLINKRRMAWDGTAWIETAYWGKRRVFHQGSVQNISTGALTAMAWDTGVGEANSSLWTYSGTTFTCVKAGYYVVSAGLCYQAYAPGTCRMVFLRDGATYVKGNSSPPNGSIDTRANVVYANLFGAGQTVDVVGYQDSGATLAMGTVSGSYIEFIYVGPYA